MVLAVQHYLETLVFADGACPAVLRVECKAAGQYGRNPTFEIALDGNEKSRTPEGTAQ